MGAVKVEEMLALTYWLFLVKNTDISLSKSSNSMRLFSLNSLPPLFSLTGAMSP